VTASKSIVVGGIWLALGAAVTIGTYAFAATQGGTYFVASGAIVVGGIRLMRGVYRIQTGRPSAFWEVTI
jgi:hypothetical protein